MNAVFSLAKITFKEGIRNRSLFGIALLALFLFGLNVSIAGFFMRDIGKVSVDINLSALSAAGLLLVFFVGVNLMAKDIDRKTIHLVLSKPISRGQYVWGKYFGIVLFVTASVLLLIVLSCLTILLLLSLYPKYFAGFSWSTFLIACGFAIFRLWLLAAIVVFFSTLTTNSLITLIFSLGGYIAGVSIEEVIFYVKSELAAKEQLISESLKLFLDWISYVLPNLSMFDFSLEASHGLAIGVNRMLLSFSYGALYIAILLILSSLVFSRREFN